MKPLATIGFYPRERFSFGTKSLIKILQHTSKKHEILIVDCALPSKYLCEIRDLVKGRPNIRLVHTDHFLMPTQSRNLIIKEASNDLICFIENDNLVGENWLEWLVETCVNYPADVVTPLLYEFKSDRKVVHLDRRVGRIVIDKNGDTSIKRHKNPSPSIDINGEARRVSFTETHCFLARKDIFKLIGGFDELIEHNDFVDFSLNLHKHNLTLVLDPRCEVTFEHPGILDRDEVLFNSMRWDYANASEAAKRLKIKWGLIDFPDAITEIVIGRNQMLSAFNMNSKIKSMVNKDSPIILADYNEWANTELVKGLKIVSLIQKNGIPWGSPLNDEMAIASLHQRIAQKAEYLLLASTWWQEYYTRFCSLVNEKFECLLRSKLVCLYSLRG